MRPIPKTMLIHSARLRRQLPCIWGDGFEAEVLLSRVRFEPYTETNQNGVNRRALMFYDARHSSGIEPGIREGDRIEFDGAVYTVAEIRTLYDGLRLHHYEIELIGGVAVEEKEAEDG